MIFAVGFSFSFFYPELLLIKKTGWLFLLFIFKLPKIGIIVWIWVIHKLDNLLPHLFSNDRALLTLSQSFVLPRYLISSIKSLHNRFVISRRPHQQSWMFLLTSAWLTLGLLLLSGKISQGITSARAERRNALILPAEVFNKRNEGVFLKNDANYNSNYWLSGCTKWEHNYAVYNFSLSNFPFLTSLVASALFWYEIGISLHPCFACFSPGYW